MEKKQKKNKKKTSVKHIRVRINNRVASLPFSDQENLAVLAPG